MAIKTSFLDNTEYSAADINAVTARLVTSGVSPGFENGKEYNLHCLNDLNKNVVTRGVAYARDTSLRVAKIDGEYYVQKGSAFFGNGTVSELTQPELISIPSGSVSYVYMVSDISNNNNYIEVSQIEPDYENNTDIVMLAQIEENGDITDRRHYARGKLPGFVNDFYTLKKKTITIPRLAVGKPFIDGTFSFDLETDSIRLMALVPAVRDSGHICVLAWDDEQGVFNGVGGTIYSEYSGYILYYHNSGSSPRVTLQSITKNTQSNTSYDFRIILNSLYSDLDIDIYYI